MSKQGERIVRIVSEKTHLGDANGIPDEYVTHYQLNAPVKLASDREVARLRGQLRYQPWDGHSSLEFYDEADALVCGPIESAPPNRECGTTTIHFALRRTLERQGYRLTIVDAGMRERFSRHVPTFTDRAQGGDKM